MSFDRSLLPDPASYYEAQGLVLKGPRQSKWRTTECVFHDGSDSMRVNIATGFFQCMSCLEKGDIVTYERKVSGAEFQDAVKAIGAWRDDGKPQQTYKPTSLSPRAALAVLAREATITAIEAARVGHGHALSQDDLDRVLQAANRINNIAREFAE